MEISSPNIDINNVYIKFNQIQSLNSYKMNIGELMNSNRDIFISMKNEEIECIFIII